jgi:mxaJ protein
MADSSTTPAETWQLLRLWVAVLASPAAWMIDLGLRYALIRTANRHDLIWPMFAVTALTLTIASAGGLYCWSRGPRRRRPGEEDSEGTLALWGLGFWAFFALLILGQTYPALWLRPTEIARAAPRPATVLRVCADPNNLPFSNQRQEGFENRIAELLAQEMGAGLQYTWWAQRRGFFRETLEARRCDVVMGVPSVMDAVAVTRPYYRGRYVFVTRSGRPPVRSFDDPGLARLRIGVPLVGDDGANPPPVHALARRGLVDNVIGFSVYGDYASDSPPLQILGALSEGTIDLAVVWGPLAGYAVRRQGAAFRVSPAQPAGELPLAFDVSVGVRRGDRALAETIDQLLQRRRDAIRKVLDDYGVSWF